MAMRATNSWFVLVMPIYQLIADHVYFLSMAVCGPSLFPSLSLLSASLPLPLLVPLLSPSLPGDSFSPLSPLPPAGEYQFSIEMSDVTAAGCVELWLSTDNNPLNMKKILVIEHSDLVSAFHYNYAHKY